MVQNTFILEGLSITEKCFSVCDATVCTLCVCLLKVDWKAESEPNQHCSQMFVKHALSVFGLHWSLLDVNVVARQVQQSSKWGSNLYIISTTLLKFYVTTQEHRTEFLSVSV